MIKAVLFDMDGVLVFAKEWHYEALNHALEEAGYAPILREAHLAYYDGLPTRMKLERLASEQNIPAEKLGQINARKQHHTQAITEAKCAPSPAHVEMLRRLRAEGYRIAVCSNSVRASVAMMMEKTGLLPFLDFYLSNEDVVRAKPAPDIYLAAMQRLAIAPQEALIVEDHPYGMRAAIAAGGYLLPVASMEDVTYERLRYTIQAIDAGQYVSPAVAS